MSEWRKFKAGEPAYTGFRSDCKPFSWVGHASHAHTAVDILKAGEIKPSLVFDESKLNTERILVTWLSPNDWWHGYRYGTTKFSFDFQKLVEGKKYYWVEAIAYNTAACRILITDKTRDGLWNPTTPKPATGHGGSIHTTGGTISMATIAWNS